MAKRKVIISGMVGNALEWYDYALYGHFAAVIAKLFFPSDNQYTSLIATFGVFAAGFLMRPVGAILFGYIGDSYGRRTALTSAITLMAVSTGLLAILPTYAQIGIAAPILLVVVRLMQGLSLGGEFSGSMVFVTEHVSGKHRNLAASSSLFSACIGILAGLFIATAISQSLSTEQFESFGWRIPFFMGVLIGLVGLYIRTNVPESPEYLEAKSKGLISKAPLSTLKQYLPQLLMGIGIYLTVTVPFYTLTVFLNTFMQKFLHHSPDNSYFTNTVAVIVMTFVIPLSAMLADKIGRKSVLVIGALGTLVSVYPCFLLLSFDGLLYPIIGQAILGVFTGIFIGPVATVLVDLFPLKVRYTGMSLSYNLSATLFGGTTPIIATYLIERTGDINAPAFYVLLSAAVTLITLVFYKDKR